MTDFGASHENDSIMQKRGSRTEGAAGGGGGGVGKSRNHSVMERYHNLPPLSPSTNWLKSCCGYCTIQEGCAVIHFT